MNKLWFGEQVSSQNRFKKFLKHAGQPTRNGIACIKYMCYIMGQNFEVISSKDDTRK